MNRSRRLGLDPLVALFVVASAALGCSRGSAGDVSASGGASASSSATLSSAVLPIPEDLAPGVTPTWPAPQNPAGYPIGGRVSHTDGRDVLWMYGGKNVKGLALKIRWRDATGTLIGWTSQTGGMFTPTDGWWKYTTMGRMPGAASVEAQVYDVMYEDGKHWQAPGMDWRYPATKPTTVQNGVGLEVTAIEREWSMSDLEGKIFVEIYNQTNKPLSSIFVSCDLKDANGAMVKSDMTTNWVPTEGDRPHPKLLPGEHDQVNTETMLEKDADRIAWSQKGLTATCKVTDTK